MNRFPMRSPADVGCTGNHRTIMFSDNTVQPYTTEHTSFGVHGLRKPDRSFFEGLKLLMKRAETSFKKQKVGTNIHDL
jgi:hypothetical protein